MSSNPHTTRPPGRLAAIASLGIVVALLATSMLTAGVESRSTHDMGNIAIVSSGSAACQVTPFAGNQITTPGAQTIEFYVDYEWLETSNEYNQWHFAVSLVWTSAPPTATIPSDWSDSDTIPDVRGQTDQGDERFSMEWAGTDFSVPGDYEGTLTLTGTYWSSPDVDIDEGDQDCTDSPTRDVTVTFNPVQGQMQIAVV